MIEICVEKKLSDIKIDVEFASSCNWQGLLGPSGCGKSMTLKMIAGIVKPDRGRIAVDGEVWFDSEKRINLKPQERRVGMLFQNYALFPHMSVMANINTAMNGIRNRAEGRNFAEYVEYLVQLLRLHGLEDRRPKELSGGQQQRVALARALASKPKIIMLDEPFSALDQHLRETLSFQLKSVLASLEGRVIMVTHNRDEIYEMCEEVVVLNRGKIVAADKVKEVFDRPKNLYAASISGCKNISPAKKIGKNLIEALDWGIELATDEEVGEEIGYVGIRAHDIVETEFCHGENIHEAKLIQTTENMFESTRIYMVGKENLWVKGPKREGLSTETRFVHLPRNKIMLLRGE